MGKRFFWFHTVASLLLGAAAYGALFHAALELPPKIFLGSALLLLILHHDVASMEKGVSFDAIVNTLQTALDHLDSQSAGSRRSSVAEALSSYARRVRIDDIASGQGIAFVYVLLAKYVGWLIGGWLLSAFLFPSIRHAA